MGGPGPDPRGCGQPDGQRAPVRAAGTAIQLSARAAGGDLVIEVRDAGPGFLPHVFERFRRPDSGRTRADGGAGLGLAIVSAIAQAHGGRAAARNLAGGGAAVTLVLPGAAGPPP